VAELNDDQLRQLCAALRWQGGTFWQVLEELQRLKTAADSASGETLSQREEVCAAWADIPDALRCHPSMRRLYRALGGVRMDDPPHGVVGLDQPQQEQPR
jgi:hypothetical protein